MTRSPCNGVRRSHLGVWLVILVGLAAALVSALLVGGARSASQASGLIAFTRTDGVYLMRSDGSGVHRIVHTDCAVAYADGIALYGGVAWSPDGSRLALATDEGIWVMNAVGTHRVRLVTSGEVGVRNGMPYSERASMFGSPSWSADGRRIAFTAWQGKNRDIWVINADGTGQHRVRKTPGLFEVEVDWSPAGGWLVFGTGGWIPDVYLIRANGSGLRNLSPGGDWDGSGQPSWSPDGHKIVFGQTEELWIMNADGSSPVQLTNNDPNNFVDSHPDWSPDGRKIVFVRTHGSPFGDSRIRDSELYAVNTDGTGLTRLTQNHFAEAGPAWQPIPEAP